VTSRIVRSSDDDVVALMPLVLSDGIGQFLPGLRPDVLTPFSHGSD
jgi:hypothetical protein